MNHSAPPGLIASALIVAVTAVAAATIPAATSADVINEQANGRQPASWRVLDGPAQERFDLGHAVFNTPWLPAGQPAGRRDGLGPLFNAASCDACHNSRRRGRGPVDDGPAPADLVMQVGRRLDDGRIERGHPRFGRLINTDAIAGFVAEGTVSIRYHERRHQRADGSTLSLRQPLYAVTTADAVPLPDDLVLMPRMAPSAQGVGLLEAIPAAAIIAAVNQGDPSLRGTAAWIGHGRQRRLGRFGWQATEASVADQVATAFAQEMGLTNPLRALIDCAGHDIRCRTADTGGKPEVAPGLFEAIVAFQRLEAPRRTPAAAAHLRAHRQDEALFHATGCGHCHRSGWRSDDGLPVDAYTDLLLHDLGDALADRDGHGQSVPSRWRIAPLWGMSIALEGGRPIRLLHDGRARSIEEAIAWHGGAAAASRDRFDALDATERQRLLDWIAAL